MESLPFTRIAGGDVAVRAEIAFGVAKETSVDSGKYQTNANPRGWIADLAVCACLMVWLFVCICMYLFVCIVMDLTNGMIYCQAKEGKARDIQRRLQQIKKIRAAKTETAARNRMR